MPAALQTAWKPVSRLLPYSVSAVTAWAFIDASTAPTNRPNSAVAAYRARSPGARPIAMIDSSTSGWETRSTTPLPYLGMRIPASTLPTPATTGTASRTRASLSSDRWWAFWISGMRVTRAAKQSPCTPKAAYADRRPRRVR